MNIFTSVKWLLLTVLAALACASCAVGESEAPIRIALLAPFEGRYREVGYDAIHAAKLALLDAGRLDIELLAVDDGGSVQTAAERARALTLDTRILAVVVLGYDAADPTVHMAFGGLQVLIVGEWASESRSENIRVFSNPDIPGQLSHRGRIDVTDAARVAAPFVGGDVFALRGFRAIRENFDGITVVTSGRIPDDEFRQRIAEIDQFAADPEILALNVYEVFRIVIHNNKENKKTLSTATPNTNYTWRDPAINYYSFNTNGILTPNNTIK